jgi:hypothetical protein
VSVVGHNCHVNSRRKKKCLRYTENEIISIDPNSWSEDNDTDQIDDSDEDDDTKLMSSMVNNTLIGHHRLPMDSDEENKLRLLSRSRSTNDIHQHMMNTIRMDSSSSLMAFAPTYSQATAFEHHN